MFPGEHRLGDRSQKTGCAIGIAPHAAANLHTIRHGMVQRDTLFIKYITEGPTLCVERRSAPPPPFAPLLFLASSSARRASDAQLRSMVTYPDFVTEHGILQLPGRACQAGQLATWHLGRAAT